jgi:YHS domain-containing protein
MKVQTSSLIDPVCGMTVDDKAEFKAQHQDKEYFFCANHCLQSFLSNPSRYLVPNNFTANSRPEASRSPFKTYFPLILILAYLTGSVLLFELKADNTNFERIMSHFMGGFFLIFSFFKFLNLQGFADSYRTYDILAKSIPLYGWLYPFIELFLGISYFVNWNPIFTNLSTFVVMSISSVGVAQSLIKKNKIQCACLGTVFNLPMSKVTLFEDLIMAVMALASLVSFGK